MKERKRKEGDVVVVDRGREVLTRETEPSTGKALLPTCSRVDLFFSFDHYVSDPCSTPFLVVVVVVVRTADNVDRASARATILVVEWSCLWQAVEGAKISGKVGLFINFDSLYMPNGPTTLFSPGDRIFLLL